MASDVEEVEEVVAPAPSGMTVFSARLPAAELGELRREAARRQTSVSELIRAAVRAHLGPQPALISLSAVAQMGTDLSVSSSAPTWVGGRVAHTVAHARIESQEEATNATLLDS
ncbi:MAG: ribbon-helix-helix domain-containing protein [Candidatus Dormibacteria bacterium]